MMSFETYKGRSLVQMKIHANQLRADNERLRDALKAADEAINPLDRGGLSLDKWNERLKAATVTIRQALTS